MYTFGYRQPHIPFPHSLIALLSVRRYRVMYHSLHAVVCQILLQLVTSRCEHREDVEYTVPPIIVRRHHEQRITHLVHISPGHDAPTLIILIKIAQLDTEHGGLQLVHTAVASLVPEHILSLEP